MKDKIMNKLKDLISKIKTIHNKIIYRIKTCECAKLVIIIVVLIVILFGIDTYVTILQNIDYQKKVQSGNDRWQQVFNIVEETKTETNILNDRVTELEQILNKIN